jgi:hypothetical protein
MTVAARNALAERQRDIASTATQAEISKFSSLIQVTRSCHPLLPPPQQLLQMSYSPDIREVLKRLEGRMTYLRESAKQLSLVSGIPWWLRLLVLLNLRDSGSRATGVLCGQHRGCDGRVHGRPHREVQPPAPPAPGS